MRKENEQHFIWAIFLLGAGVLSSFIYLFTYHFFASFRFIFEFLTIVFLILGLLKILNSYSRSFHPKICTSVRWIHSLLFELIAICVSSFLRPFRCSSSEERGVSEKQGRPILLIHGYLQNSSNWIFIKWALKRKGFGPIYTLNLKPLFGSIGGYGELVSKKAAEIAKVSRREDLTLIGHSMGGLVSLWYAAKIASPGTIKQVITLGSPLRGTKLAKIALGQNGREMQWASEFTKLLQQDCLQRNDMPFYHIASATDQIVRPYQSALSGIRQDREWLFSDLGHISLVFSPRIVDKIEEWLLQGD